MNFTVAPGAPCSTTRSTNANQRRVLSLEDQEKSRAIGFIGQISDEGTGSYHGTKLTVQRRAASGVNINGNYTYGHCIANRNLGGGGTPSGISFSTPFNPDSDRGNCVQDRRHLVNVSVVATTPDFGTPTINQILGSWTFSGIFRTSSGSPINIDTNRDDNFDGLRNNDRPSLVPGQNPFGDQDSVTNFFNVNAFRRLSADERTTLGFNALHGPGNWGLDVSATKAFQVGETQTVEFRAEAFNLTNTLRPGNPENTITNANFGLIRSGGDPRIIQFALKYAF